MRRCQKQGMRTRSESSRTRKGWARIKRIAARIANEGFADVASETGIGAAKRKSILQRLSAFTGAGCARVLPESLLARRAAVRIELGGREHAGEWEARQKIHIGLQNGAGWGVARREPSLVRKRFCPECNTKVPAGGASGRRKRHLWNDRCARPVPLARRSEQPGNARVD